MSYNPCIWWPGCGAMIEGGCEDCPADAEEEDEYEDEDEDDDG